ncbi:MAG: LacI family transcriptional regulator [Betaproteobacteria bacterium]|jgi:tripartite-type tricarboxylate transporter receptor subunit TctC|nr:LacI family transcriptional regulator [Betaproteobacteria bacterium]
MKSLLVAVAAVTLSWPGALFAQAYPARPVRYLVPFPAGGSPDIVARLLSERLNRLWGQPVVVENRSGAGGTVAATVAAKATPDGYTLFQCNIASNAIAYSLYAKLPYHPLRDFAPISRIGTTPSALVVHPSMPAASIGGFIEYARANPGKVSYGSSGVGSSPQLAMELFQSMAKIKLVHIAYKGAAPAIADLLGGQIPVGIANVPALLPPVQAGRIRALAVTGAKRFSQWPSVPTLAESGMPGYDVTSWYGVCAPAGTPRPIIAKLHAGLSTVLLAPEVQQRMNDMVIDAAPTSPEEFAEFIRSETSRWAKVIKDAGISQQ